MQRIQIGSDRPQTLAERHRAMRAQIAANSTAAPDLQDIPVAAPSAQRYVPERQWFLMSSESGTPWLGDVFGF